MFAGCAFCAARLPKTDTVSLREGLVDTNRAYAVFRVRVQYTFPVYFTEFFLKKYTIIFFKCKDIMKNPD